MVCLRVAWECAVIDAASIATTSFVIDVWVNRFTIHLRRAKPVTKSFLIVAAYSHNSFAVEH